MKNLQKEEGGNNSCSMLLGRWRTQIVFLILGVCLLCFMLFSSSYPFEFLPRNYFYTSSALSKTTQNVSDSGGDDLDRVLRAASMVDKTVIITTMNRAWAEPNSLMDIFLESFHISNQTRRLLKNLVIVSLDQMAYDRCLSKHPHCYALRTDGANFSSSEAYFMTPEYLKMMWRRIEFLTSVLEKGYNFVFTDADIVWLRDPFPRFHLDADFQIACDLYYGNSTDINNLPNGGFNYVKSNCRTIVFYKFWNSSRETYPGLHDQDVLNKIKYDPFITKLGLKIRFLDTAYFGGFCEPSKDLNLVCTMHANCCFGLESKVHDLRVILDNWKNYTSSFNKTLAASPSWSAPQKCSLNDFHPPAAPKEEGKTN